MSSDHYFFGTSMATFLLNQVVCAILLVQFYSCARVINKIEFSVFIVHKVHCRSKRPVEKKDRGFYCGYSCMFFETEPKQTVPLFTMATFLRYWGGSLTQDLASNRSLLKDLKSATSNSKASILNLVYLFFIRRHKGHAINKLQASIINSKWLIIQLINTELNLILFKFAWTFGYYWMSIEKIGCWNENSYTIELL